MSAFFSQETKLVWFAADGNLDKVRHHFKKGANVNGKLLGQTGLFMACQNGHMEVVRAFLNHEEVDVNITSLGQTSLFIASHCGHLEVVRALLNHEGVDVNFQNWVQHTALFTASQFGRLEVVRALLNHKGVDVNIKDDDGNTALDAARNEKHDDVVRLLEEHIEGERKPSLEEEREKRLQEEEQMRREAEELKRRQEEAQRHYDAEEQRRRQEEERKRREAEEENRRKVEAQKRRDAEEQRRRQEEELKRRQEEEQERREEEEQMRRQEEEQERRDEEERNRRKDTERKEALEEMRRRQELLNRKSAGRGGAHRVTGEPPVRRNDENSPFIDDSKIEQDRRKLLNVMNTTSAEPVELSLEYIERCRTSHELGSGAFGNVYLAHDSRLPKMFAVKMINPTHCDQDTIKEIRRSFQMELSTLKRFQHPNIIVLYGFSLNANSTKQCLVYEYAANGSLAGFFTDDGHRARLSADIRLSIMFELVRAVHFLHTGGCKVSDKGWKVFHRDIKSANICLADDFTPRLIDCGLAKFVRDDDIANPAIPRGAVTPSMKSTSRDGTFGTPGYMCPEYVRKKTRGLACPYIAAYDVYSIGVVLVEIILGCLTGGQSTRNGTQFLDVFEMYVKDDRDRLIVDGWKKLIDDADHAIVWNAASLELVCKAAIQCMSPFSDERLSTKDLLDKLRDAIGLNSGMGTVRQYESVNAVVVGDSRPYCDICNDYHTDIKCSKGHALCASCIKQNVLYRLSDRCQLLCLINGCTSQPLHDKDLIECITVEMYNQIIEKRTEKKIMNKYLDRIEAKIDVLISDGQKQQQMLQELSKGLHRSLAALALLSANQFKECPNLVWVTPTSVDKNYLRNPKKWFTQKYSVVFICAHSHEPGHAPFEIEVPKGWIAKIAPWLKLCLQVLKTIATSQGLPFPIPNLPFREQYEMMKTFLDSAIEKASNAIVARCEALLENGTMSIDTYGQMQTLAGDAFKFIAEKARKEKRSQWKPPQMVPVCDHNGTPMWVKGRYQAYYGVNE